MNTGPNGGTTVLRCAHCRRPVDRDLLHTDDRTRLCGPDDIRLYPTEGTSFAEHMAWLKGFKAGEEYALNPEGDE